MNNLELNSNVGWICPRCGKSITPSLNVCPHCSTTYADEGLKPGEQLICDAEFK